jgi:hypothetical protein
MPAPGKNHGYTIFRFKIVCPRSAECDASVQSFNVGQAGVESFGCERAAIPQAGR